MSKRTIESEFNRWLLEFHGVRGLTLREKNNLRRTFYSGAFVLLSLQSDLAKENDEATAVAKMDIVLHELTTRIIGWNEGKVT